jgi:uncharacterized protein YecE (DUF72 family)
MMRMTNLFIGTSGYSYKTWRGAFYPKGVPQKDWLAFYAQTYNAVEVNATFYRPFPASVFTHWREVTPPEFRFVLKGPKVITHEKLLDNVDEELSAFVSSTAALHEKQAAMLWQFSASIQVNSLGERFAQFLQMLPTGIKQVFEFRHPSWFVEEVYDLLNHFQAGFVINDSPHFASREVITGNVMYVRFHGPDKLYNSLYSDQQLRLWADKIQPRLDQNDVYLFFNNTFAGQGLKNAIELRELLLK